MILPELATIREAVLSALRAHSEGLTAEEVQAITGYSLNSVRSRITELSSIAVLLPIGKRKSPRSGVSVSVWRARQ